jgi:hypothetical protein
MRSGYAVHGRRGRAMLECCISFKASLSLHFQIAHADWNPREYSEYPHASTLPLHVRMHADTLRCLRNLRRRTGRPQGNARVQLAKIEDGGSDAEKELLIAVKAKNPDASFAELLSLFQVSP